MKKLILAGLMLFGGVAWGQSIPRLSLSGVAYAIVKTDSTSFYNSIRNTTWQIFDSVDVATVDTPSAGKIHVFSRGLAGMWGRFSDGALRRLDTTAAGGAGTGTITTGQNQGYTGFLPFKDTTGGVIRQRTLFENNANLGFTSGADSTELTLTASPTFTTTTTDSLRSTGGVKIANTAKVVIDGTDASQVAGQVAVYEAGGELELTGRDDIDIGLDNDASNHAEFNIFRNGLSGTNIFTVGETTGVRIMAPTGYRGTLRKAFSVYRPPYDHEIFTILSDSNVAGAITNKDWRPVIFGNSAVEGQWWVDEDLMMSRFETFDTMSLASPTAVGDTFIVVNVKLPTWGPGRTLTLGDLTVDSMEVIHVQDTAGTTFVLNKELTHAWPAGTVLYPGRWRGAIYPTRDLWSPSGKMLLGVDVSAAEADNNHIQRIDVGKHTAFVQPLASAFAPMVLFGGVVDTTAPASMSVNVSAGQFIRGGSGTQAYTLWTTAQTVTHAAADNDSARIDLVYWDSVGVAKIVTGAKELTPVAPTLPTGGTQIAWDTIAAGVSSVAKAKMVDKRQTSMRLYPVDGVVGIGTDTVVVSAAGRNYLALRGSTHEGRVEFSSNQADATGNPIGYIQATDINSTAANKRIAAIQFTLTGGTANNRGGTIDFNVKADGASGVTTAMRIDTNASTNFGSGNVIVNKDNKAEIEIDGADGSQTTGTNSLFESGGEFLGTSRGSFIFRIDNDSNATASRFSVRANQYQTTDVFAVGELGNVVSINRTATEGNFGLAGIVDTVVRSAQTAAISATNFTNAAGGTSNFYRVMAYAECTTLSGSGSPTLDVTISWTDDVGATTSNIISGLSLSATGRAQNVGSYLVTSGNLQWSTTINSAAGTPQYKIYLVCERLN